MREIFTQKLRGIFLALCLLLMSNINVLAQQALPSNGWHYKIKNYDTNTYLGGNTAGSNNVKHEDASTNPTYHVFLVTGDNTTGYNLINFTLNKIVTHSVGNAYTMAYSDGASNQLFKLQDKTTYFNISKSTSTTQGIGFDNVASGSLCYSDKGEVGHNKWVFEAVVDSFQNVLTRTISQATTLYNANTGGIGAADLQTAINTATTYTTGSGWTTSISGSEIITAVTDLKAAMKTFVQNNASNSNPMDISFVGVNFNMEKCANTNTIGWAVASDGGTWGTKLGVPTSNLSGRAMEVWNNKLQGKTRSATQSLTGLPNGIYSLQAAAWAVDQRTGTYAQTGTVQLFAGSATANVSVSSPNPGDANVMTNAALYTIQNIVVSDGTLSIGFRDNQSNGNWIGFDNVKLYYYGSLVVPLITTSKSQFAFVGNDNYLSDNLTVSGINLSDPISISAPAGITVDPTSLAFDANNATVTITYDGTTTVNGNITFTSGAATATVTVTGAPNTGCFTPLYSTGNLIADPYMNSFTGFSNWGGTSIVTGSEAYCGTSCGKISGTGDCWPNGGSISKPITWKTNNVYRERVVVKAVDGSFGLGHGKTYTVNSNGAGNFVVSIPQTSTAWLSIDTTFVTGASAGTDNVYLANCDATGIHGRVAYVDNWELYAMPTWNGTGTWSTPANWGGSVPASGADIYVLSGTLTIDQNISVANVTVYPGAKVTLNSGNTLTVTGNLAIKSDATGTGTFVDLNPTGGLTVSGTTHVQQYLTSGRNWYVSSPVSAATTAALSTATSVVSYDEVHGTSAPWVTESGSLTPMKGYISVNTTTSGVVTFSGTLNTGAQTITPTRTTGQTKEGFNLVGNPYPSYVNWTNATKTNLLTTMWYRTKSASAYVFDTYNATGGVGTSNGLTTVSNLIPPMQAFWVRVDVGQTSGTLSFTNAMRSHADVSGNSFKAPAATKVAQQLVRLKVSNGANSDEAVIYFNANASNGYDAYDSPKMTNANTAIPEIYTMGGTEKLVINGLNSVAPNEELPLGFTTGESNSFTIKATQFSNFDGSTKIYLKDNLLNTEQELAEGTEYSFNSDIASTSTRFSVVFKSAGTATGLDNANGNQVALISKNANNQISVNCRGDISSDASVSVYNGLGQKIHSKLITSSNTVIGTAFAKGVYVITVNNGGQRTTKKIVLN